jgi:hypothetical protein
MLTNFKEKATDLKNQAGDYLQSDTFKQILPYLLSGGTGAVLGGVLTGRRREEEGEGRMGHLRRVLTNALIGGGLAGGAHWLVNKGVDSVRGIQAGGGMPAAEDKVKNPLEQTARSIAFSPFTAAATGAAGLIATDGRPIIGAGRNESSKALTALAERLGVSEKHLTSRTAEEIAGMGLSEPNNKLRRLAGLGSGEGWRGTVSSVARKNPLLSTFGQTWPRRAWRGGLGLAAAGVPALLGAYLTSPQET